MWTIMKSLFSIKKEGNRYESLETMEWGCGRIMPQGLNESIILIRLLSAMEMVKEDMNPELLRKVKEEFIPSAYRLLKPQVVAIHNISCWANSGIGVMGLFACNQEMIDFAFEGEYNNRRQLREGVTKDFFWYEGSIHYNFFTLEGMVYLSMFADHYNYDFGEELGIIENMLLTAFDYAFPMICCRIQMMDGRTLT